MPKRRVAVHRVPGAKSTARAIAFLVLDDESEVNVEPALHRLENGTFHSVVDERNKVWAHFRDWVNGGKGNDGKWHHGWPTDPIFGMGYVFRWDNKAGQHRRLWGFLMTPRPGFEVCILCCYGAKDTHRTEPAIKRVVRAVSERNDVRSAVRNAFNRGGKGPWTVH
jgi:hypothetical protein